MSCMDILQDNIFKLMDYYHMQNYKQLCNYTSTNYNTLKTWMTKKNYPRLTSLDKLSDDYGFCTCELFAISPIYNTVDIINDSNSKVKINIKSIMLNTTKLSLEDELSVFQGSISRNEYISYFRKTNSRNIPLNKLELMSKHLNVSLYNLLK